MRLQEKMSGVGRSEGMRIGSFGLVMRGAYPPARSGAARLAERLAPRGAGSLP